MSEASAQSSISSASGFLAEVLPGSQVSVAFWIAIGFVAAALVLIVIASMTWIRSRPGVESGPTKGGVGVLDAAAPAASPTTEEAQNLLRLMGEADEVCRRLGAELDAKAERVQRLLARLEGMMQENGDATPRVAPAGGAPGASVRVASTSGEAARPEIVVRPLGGPVPAPVAAAEVAPSTAASRTAGAPATSVAIAGNPSPAGADAVTQQVCQLADAGMTAAEIAKALGQHVGKVELILALRAV